MNHDIFYYSDGATSTRFDPTKTIHRVDEPAAIYVSGLKYWYQNGQLHRLNGPAIEYPNGDKSWYQNGLPHRLDGPAFEYAAGYKHRLWYLFGIQYDEEMYLRMRKPGMLELL
jgi:hypothetical protein